VLSLDDRARMRAALAFDIVLFAADCPACGGPAEWLQQREDTRLRTRITCTTPTCAP
jgi:transposase